MAKYMSFAIGYTDGVTRLAKCRSRNEEFM
jgi:hypothetical protein